MNQKATARFNHIFDELEAKNEHGQSHPLWKDSRISQFGFAMLCLLCDIGTLKPDWRDILKDTDRLRHVLSYVHGNLGQKITARRMAAQMGLSLSQFYTIFQEKIRKAPLEYVQQARLEEASRQLITTDKPMRFVAEKTGFYDEFHFSRAFKKYFKVTPSVFRQTHRPTPR